MEYEDFELQVGPQSSEGVLVRVRSPAGEGGELTRLPESLLKGLGTATLGPTRDAALSIRPVRLSPEETGSQLYQSLFAGQVGDLFHQSLSRIRSDPPQRGLRIRFRVNLRDVNLGDVHLAPWELLYRRDTEDFLGLSRLTPIVRSLDVPRASPPRPIDPPLRVLVIRAPAPDEDLNLDGELEELAATLRRNPLLDVDVVRDPDPRTLRQVLGGAPFHVLHYMGHGAFDPGTGEGALVFRDPSFARVAVSGRHLATKIKDLGSVRLVVLNACETALADGVGTQGPFAGVATALVLGGIPAVVAMQSPILDTHAVAFSAAFYDRLSQGLPVEEAVTEGRQAIHSLNVGSTDWAVPVLFLRASSVPLFTLTPSSPSERPARHGVPRMAVLLTLLLTLAPATLTLTKPRQAAEMTELPQVETVQPDAIRPRPSEPRQEKIPSTERETAKSSARTIQVGNEFRAEIAGHIPDGFDDPLEEAARKLVASGLLGSSGAWTLHLDISTPRLNSSTTEAGFSSCRITARSRVHGRDKSENLGSSEAVRLAMDGDTACADAAELLAREVVQKFASFLREESI